MDGPQICLKLLLDKLGISADISTFPDRKRVQKAVFIAKMFGEDLGYSYGWYVYGPYSPELTQDYFELSENLYDGETDYEQYSLVEDVATKLDNIKSIYCPPSGVNLPQEDWLELIASILYWKDKAYNESDIRQMIRDKKGHLFEYYDQALSAINSLSFLSS